MADGDHSESGTSAAEHRRENPLAHLSNADIRAVADCLNDAAYSLLAVRRLAIDALQADEGAYPTAIADLACSTFKRLHGCIVRFTGDPGIGNCASEFEDAEAESAA